MMKEDDMKIVGKTDVGGRTGWDEDGTQRKESDKERMGVDWWVDG